MSAYAMKIRITSLILARPVGFEPTTDSLEVPGLFNNF